MTLLRGTAARLVRDSWTARALCSRRAANSSARTSVSVWSLECAPCGRDPPVAGCDTDKTFCGSRVCKGAVRGLRVRQCRTRSRAHRRPPPRDELVSEGPSKTPLSGLTRKGLSARPWPGRGRPWPDDGEAARRSTRLRSGTSRRWLVARQLHRLTSSTSSVTVVAYQTHQRPLGTTRQRSTPHSMRWVLA